MWVTKATQTWYSFMSKFTLMKKIASLVLFLTFPVTSFAHVKWFAEDAVSVRPYSLTDAPVLIWFLISVALVFLGIYLEKKLHVPKRVHAVMEKCAPYVLSIASMGFGLSFLLFSYYGFIFAPNLPGYGFSDVLIIIQIIAGFLILFGFYERIGGLLLLALFLMGIGRYGFGEMMDTLEMLGFAVYAIIVGRPKFKIIDLEIFDKIRHKIHSYGLIFLRLGVGINLIVLGFSEKILRPALTADFLSKYDWNFMQKIGFESFSNYWFGFSAGVVEILFGLFFILGLVTRTTTVVLAVFLVSTLLLLGPTELIGHLPHFSIAIVLLTLGSGTKMVLRKKQK